MRWLGGSDAESRGQPLAGRGGGGYLPVAAKPAPPPGAFGPGGCARCCGACCCWASALMAWLLVVYFVLLPSPPGPSGPTTEGVKPASVTEFFYAEEVIDFVPLPPPTYPKNLQGMIWLDTFGAYGPTEVGQGFQDGVISFGDTEFATLNTETRELLVSTSGPAWTWFNNAQAYGEYDSVASIGSYLFQWNADYTEARLWPASNILGRLFYVPFIVKFWVTRMPPPPAGACPPPPSTAKEDRAVCAKWVRTSCILGCAGSWFGINGPSKYYVWEVVDAAGQPVEPYYSAAIDFSKSRAQPDPEAAKRYNSITLGTMGLEPGTIFHGRYSAP